MGPSWLTPSTTASAPQPASDLSAPPSPLPCLRHSTALPSGELTLDHVIPRSRGGLSTWENLVACCHPCKRRKGNQLPLDAGMKPAREPRAFNLHTSRHIMRLMGHSDDKWRKYLFY